MMPLDCSVNEDLDCGVHWHITLTTLLETNDSQKFSLAVPKETACSYICVFDPTFGPDAGVPCLQHILQDCKKLRSDYKEIHDKQGVLVPGLRSRKLH